MESGTFLQHATLEHIARRHGTTTWRAGLFAPDALPGHRVWDPHSNGSAGHQSPRARPGDTAPMTSLFIVNDSPYGTERGFNALRLATNLQPRQEEDGGAAHLPGRRFAVPSGQRVNYVDRRAAAGAPGQGRSDDVE